jgi:hypothetical protein
MKHTRWLLLSFLALIFLNNCKRDPEPNPCEGINSTNAQFIVEQKVGDRWFEGDTIISSQINGVRFTAKQNADSYTWIIGSEIINTKSFIRTWFPEKSNIPITLIVKRSPNNACFPNDDGIDTVIKTIYVWHGAYGPNPAQTPSDTLLSPYFPIYGTYYGESTIEPGIKKFVTLIDTVWTDEINRPKRVGLIRGFPNKQLSTEKIRNASIHEYANDVGFRSIHLSMKTAVGGVMGYPYIPRMEGYAWLDRNDLDKINIDYKYLDTATNNWKHDIFTGNRVW